MTSDKAQFTSLFSGGKTSLIGEIVVFIDGPREGQKAEIVGIDCCQHSFMLAMLDGEDRGVLMGYKAWGNFKLLRLCDEQ